MELLRRSKRAAGPKGQGIQGSSSFIVGFGRIKVSTPGPAWGFFMCDGKAGFG
jgi:hypothetical protein